MKKFILIIPILLVIGGALVWALASNRQPAKVQPVNLTIWGLWEDESLYKPVIDRYQAAHPNVTITYNHQASLNYRTRLQTKLLANEGPDIFMLHDTWTPMFLQSGVLASLPETVMTKAEYSQTFYPVAKEMLSNYFQVKPIVDADASIVNKQLGYENLFAKSGLIYGFPTGVDGLAMFYNEEILRGVGGQVPKTWVEFQDVAKRVTVPPPGSSGPIQTAGAALGTTGNVDHWPDIIGLLFAQQPGADPGNPAAQSTVRPGFVPGADILSFYTSFAKTPSKTWDATMESSTVAFASGRLAFYFAPSWRAYELKQINPQLQFKVAPVPQLPGGNKAAWASFWAFAVSNKSPNQAAAWDFLKTLTAADSLKSIYQTASATRLFGQPYPRVDLQAELINDPLVGAFVAQGPDYKSWYLSSRTLDAGLNDEMIKYYEDAINSINQGADPTAALSTTTQGVKDTLDKYTKPVPSPSAK